MHDQPPPTDEEHEQTPERLEEEQAKQYPAHDDPPEAEDFADSE